MHSRVALVPGEFTPEKKVFLIRRISSVFIPATYHKKIFIIQKPNLKRNLHFQPLDR